MFSKYKQNAHLIQKSSPFSRAFQCFFPFFSCFID